jgi:hypothetical protein
MSPDEIQRRHPRPAHYEPETADVQDVRRIFGLRETLTYRLYYLGLIKGVLIPGPKGKRGKRLFYCDSIRKYLAECTAKEQEKEAVAP